ncbi:unnamed protein product [Rotaria sp. Silwood1]|nr:unnamed protein product [Rotaria sp. Silwood1]CAF3719617.1 unnamed protein product [Rotaria sp. Silwood1]CAF3790296.1 unnamed protein product [Rotaria sp. Silwood1]CAF5098090.1 unnamed protein product [Rotaria sp. Silwood1]
METKLIQHQHRQHEIYGQYIDDVFMTTNLTKEEILHDLEETTKNDENIKVTITIKQALEYLDASTKNNNGKRLDFGTGNDRSLLKLSRSEISCGQKAKL